MDRVFVIGLVSRLPHAPLPFCDPNPSFVEIKVYLQAIAPSLRSPTVHRRSLVGGNHDQRQGDRQIQAAPGNPVGRRGGNLRLQSCQLRSIQGGKSAYVVRHGLGMLLGAVRIRVGHRNLGVGNRLGIRGRALRHPWEVLQGQLECRDQQVERRQVLKQEQQHSTRLVQGQDV